VGNGKTCKECGAALKPDEIAIYMKLVTRNARKFLCIDCLSVKLKCERRMIDERIKYYRESGNCTLFR